MNKRYSHELTAWDLPKKGERSIHLGRVAESNHEAYFDIDELTKHAIIAGSTGGGKTVTAQVIAEEALQKNIQVLVIDPTAQWTGFLKPLDDQKIQKKFEYFGINKNNTHGYPTNILKLHKENTNITQFPSLNTGEITVWLAHDLREYEIDRVVTGLINSVFKETPNETQQLKTILIFEEIHRILRKYGGTGVALRALERAVREFRKWGIGIILISQVLEDFDLEIRANIGTEFQMRTSYEEDLEKVRLKYGDATAKAVVREETGTAMLHNSNYNIGRPYFVQIRPTYHDFNRLSDSEFKRITAIYQKIEEFEASKKLTEEDTLNIKLTKREISRGNVRTAETYVDEISERKTI